MRTTVTVSDELWEEARRVSGASTNKALVERGLQALIDQEARRRAIALAGSMPKIHPVSRRRMAAVDAER